MFAVNCSKRSYSAVTASHAKHEQRRGRTHKVQRVLLFILRDKSRQSLACPTYKQASPLYLYLNFHSHRSIGNPPPPVTVPVSLAPPERLKPAHSTPEYKGDVHVSMPMDVQRDPLFVKAAPLLPYGRTKSRPAEPHMAAHAEELSVFNKLHLSSKTDGTSTNHFAEKVVRQKPPLPPPSGIFNSGPVDSLLRGICLFRKSRIHFFYEGGF